MCEKIVTGLQFSLTKLSSFLKIGKTSAIFDSPGEYPFRKGKLIISKYSMPFRREVELDIVLPRVNNFDIKHKKKTWNICFIICHQHQTRSGKIKAKGLGKPVKHSVKHQCLTNV